MISSSAPADGLDAESLDRREAACRQMIVEAAGIALAGFHALNSATVVAMKGPQDFLTETDGQVEAFLKERIAQLFPDDGFLGEEGGGELTEHLWVVDPIDGTANFARGVPHFCISIAFVTGARVEFGAIANPVQDELYLARRGRGATRNGVRLAAAATTSFQTACVELGWSARIANERYLATLAAILAKGANVRRSASGALGLAYVADGRSDAYVELHINAWDCLAGLLLVEEAGGRTSGFMADGGLLHGNPVLAAAPGIADAMSATTAIALGTATLATGSGSAAS